jgi:hypothetical protein
MDKLDVLPWLICWLQFVDGKSQCEIGWMFERPHASVRAMLVKALAKRRQCLANQGFELDPLANHRIARREFG